MDREVWRATVHGVSELDMTEATEHESDHELGIVYNHEPKKVPVTCPGGDCLPRGDRV